MTGVLRTHGCSSINEAKNDSHRMSLQVLRGCTVVSSANLMVPRFGMAQLLHRLLPKTLALPPHANMAMSLKACI